jgi:hypothetical protein
MPDRSMWCAPADLLRAATLLLIAGAAACGNLTVGGFGEASVAFTDAPDPDPGAAPSPGPAAVGAGSASERTLSTSAHSLPLRDGDVRGEIELTVSLFLVAQDGNTVQLGPDGIEIEIELQEEIEVDAVDTQLIPATRYVEFRVVFTDIEIEVQGLVVNGVPVPAVDVEIENTSLVASRSIDLDVREGDRVKLVVDLNSLAWLRAVDVLTGVVDGAVFARLIDVAIQ